MSENINISLEGNTKVLEILTGKAVERHAPSPLIVEGTIDAPYRFLKSRIDVIEIKESHLLVSDNRITLCINEKSIAGFTEITGRLVVNPDFLSFGINEDKKRDTFELADFIKMNRHFFNDRSTAMKLVNDLKNFKAEISKQVEKSNNDRGNTRFLKDQVVESNIPEIFSLNMPIFKGDAPVLFEVEVMIDPQSFECRLISPYVRELIAEEGGARIDYVVTQIETLVPELAIMSV